jgi:hypothetical protein
MMKIPPAFLREAAKAEPATALEISTASTLNCGLLTEP